MWEGCPAPGSPLPCPQKLEEQDRRALSIKEQLQQEHRFLKRRLEQLSVQSLERVRTDSTGSAVSTDDSEQGGDEGAALGGKLGGGGELPGGGWAADARLPGCPERPCAPERAGPREVRPRGRRPAHVRARAGLGRAHASGAPAGTLTVAPHPGLFPPEVDVEGMEFGPGELDSVGSSSDVEDHYSLQSGGCSDGGYAPPCRRPGRPGLL